MGPPPEICLLRLYIAGGPALMHTDRPKHGTTSLWRWDGTRAYDFSYKLRPYPERANPVWTHCLHRHWDLSFVLTLHPRAKLEALHGSFATSLLKSLVVRSVFSPSCPGSVPSLGSFVWLINVIAGPTQKTP